MKPSRLSASSGAKSWSASLLSAGLMSLSLTACATRAVKPSPAPVLQCSQPRTAEIPDWPDDWLADGPEFAIRVLGILTEERRLEGVELDCLDALREAGVIR
jgi:hypothetical protein